MKKLIILVLLLSFCVTSNTVFAQEESAELTNLSIVGMRYDKEFLGTFGVGVKLGGPIWTFDYGDFGDDQSVATELAVVFKANTLTGLMGLDGIGFLNNLFLGVLLGPNFELIGTNDNTGINDGRFMSYVAGAVGGLGAYSVSDKIGVWAIGKRKFALEEGNGFLNNWLWGGGMYWKF